MVEDLDVDGIHVRVYRPPGESPKPGVIYFHGGGWVVGSCETHDDMCAEMADQADVVVVMVDYRLAPENPHPAQLEDSLKVLDWMRNAGRALGIDPTRIIGAGDSAGGQMDGGPGTCAARPEAAAAPRHGADLSGAGRGYRNGLVPAQRQCACLTRDEMIFYLESFLGARGTKNWTDPYAVPNTASDISGLPPAYITVAAHDPLCDDGIFFRDKMKAAGLSVDLREEPALAHSYMRARHVSKPAMEGFKAIVNAMKHLAHEGCLPG